MTSRDHLPTRYEIRIASHVDARWAPWFDTLTLTPQSDGTTLLSGVLPDQAALHGTLQKLRDAALPLISVTPVDPSRSAS